MSAEPQVPTCSCCSSTKGPWRPTGDRYPSGAQVLVCTEPCTPTEPLTDRQLADIRRREAAATKGPWSNDGHEIYVGTPDDYTRHSLWIGETCNIDLPDNGDANGAFLAHARQDVPALLASHQLLTDLLAQARVEATHNCVVVAPILVAEVDAAEARAERLLAEVNRLTAELAAAKGGAQ